MLLIVPSPNSSILPNTNLKMTKTIFAIINHASKFVCRNDPKIKLLPQKNAAHVKQLELCHKWVTHKNKQPLTNCSL